MDEQGSENLEELDLEPATTVRSRRPRVLWAVLAVVAVAAGALVVTSTDDDGDQRPGLPVDLASTARSAGADGEAAADSSMLAWVTYVPGDDLPALGGEATAYRLNGDVDEAQVRALAAALGLEGDVKSEAPDAWSVVGEGGVGRLVVYAPGGASWTFFSGDTGCIEADGSVAGCSGGEECVTASTGEMRCTSSGAGAGSSGKPVCESEVDCDGPVPTTTVTDCANMPPDAPCASPPAAACAAVPGEEPEPCDDVASLECQEDATGALVDCVPTDGPIEPSADRPDEDEARAAALEVVAAAGIDVAGARVTADGGYDRWLVTIEPELDGVPSGLFASVEVGPDLVVISASGFMGQPEPLGEYPLLDTHTAIERANDQGANAAVADDAPVTTVVGSTEPGSTDPCAAPDGASDGCGGTTGCGDDGCVEPPTTSPCKVQPDGSEICEFTGCAGASSVGTAGGGDGVQDPAVDVQPCEVPTCPQPPEGDGVGAPDAIADCAPPPVDPEPIPEPEPVEIVLVDAEPSLVLLPANDGSGDGYLVPAYRFTAEDGGTVDLPAVADDALAGSPSTDTTVPDTVVPEPVPEPQPCEVLEERDASGTTHTVQTCPTPNEGPRTLGEGEEPVVGVGYYVEATVLDDHCTWLVVRLGDQIWWTPGYYKDDLYGWSQPTEGGTFTIHEDDTAEFVGDADHKKVATLVPWEDGPDGPLCA